MMLGMLVTSIASGRIITRWGRYKPFPIAGTAIMTFGLVLVSRLSVEGSVWQTSFDASVLGFGMGMVMQVLVLAVQNSVDTRSIGRRDLRYDAFPLDRWRYRGFAFRRDLRQRTGPQPAPRRFLRHRPHVGRQSDGAAGAVTCSAGAYAEAVMTALHPVFLLAAAVAALGFVLTWLLNEAPLRDTAATEGMEKPSPCRATQPRWRNSSTSSARSPFMKIDEGDMPRWRKREADLPPPELWLLARLGERPRCERKIEC